MKDYMIEHGKFIISLDFELMWGVRDVVDENTYGEHIRGEHTAVPRLLKLLEQFDIKATFATVGFLFFKNKTELLDSLPNQIPRYTDRNLSPYGEYMHRKVGDQYPDDQYHYGAHLVDLIKKAKGQEIATHTFSHFYCLEPGQTKSDFREDLRAAIEVAKKWDLKIETIIFPRNQVNPEYLDVCMEMGIRNYRNNEQSWIYEARSWEKESLVRRFVRLLDAYINISGHHCYKDDLTNRSILVNVPSSRFLRPYTAKLKWFEGMRLRRIKKAMTFAAKNNLLFHLWWHPHNFGINQDQNFEFLKQILLHYKKLNQEFGFANYTMGEYGEMIADISAKQTIAEPA